MLNLGNWQGTVAQVVHIPEKHRKDGISTHIELVHLHQVREGVAGGAPGASCPAVAQKVAFIPTISGKSAAPP